MNLLLLSKLETLKLRANYNYVMLFVLAFLGFLLISAIIFMTMSINGQDAGALLDLNQQFISIFNRIGQLSSFIIVLLAILNSAAEYRNLSFKRNIMDGLTKDQLFASKIIGMLILILVSLLLIIVIMLVVGVGMKGLPAAAVFSNIFSGKLVKLFVKLIFAAGFGLLLITLLRSGSFAIISLFGYLLFEMIIGLVEKFRFQTNYADYLPHNFVNNTLALPNITLGQAALIASYIIFFYAAAWVVFRWRDL